MKLWTQTTIDLLEQLKTLYNMPWILYIRPSIRFIKYLERRLK